MISLLIIIFSLLIEAGSVYQYMGTGGLLVQPAGISLLFGTSRKRNYSVVKIS